MNIAMFTRASLVVAVAFAIILSAGTSSEVLAQRAADTYSIFSDDTIVGLAPQQRLKLRIFNGARNPVVPNVRVYSATGTLLLSGVHTPLSPGQFDSFNLDYSHVEQLPGDPGTGRREVRIELWMTYTGLETDAQRIKSTYDLVDAVTGQSILVGMLLPAIQKVREQ